MGDMANLPDGRSIDLTDYEILTNVVLTIHANPSQPEWPLRVSLLRVTPHSVECLARFALEPAGIAGLIGTLVEAGREVGIPDDQLFAGRSSPPSTSAH